MSDKKFVHLHCHDKHSILDGISEHKDLIKICKNSGMGGFAITNHGSMANTITKWKDCTDAGVKFIIGCEFYTAPDTRLGRTYAKKADAAEEARSGDLNYYAYHLTVLAKNRDGYDSIKKLNTIAWREGFYYKPRIDHEVLEQNKNGLIVLSGCLASKTSQLILAGQKEKALEEIDKMRKIFGEDFYLEVMNHHIDEEEIVRKALIEFGNTHGIGLIMTGDSHYTEHGDELAHEAALAIGTGKTLSDPKRFQFNGEGYWFKTPEEMYKSAEIAEIPESALTNTVAIADKIEDYGFKLASKTKKFSIPLFKDDEGNTYTDEQCHEFLSIKAFQGLAERGLISDPSYIKQLEEELDLIKRKNFSSYFLIIADIVDFMRKSKMPIPIGRGSSVGSLLCYSLFITGLDPNEIGALFSRFVNEGRIDLPDIDTDISQERRKEVLDYIVNKYGKDKVATIATFQSMGAKAAVDNVGRVLDIPTTIRRTIGKLLGAVDKDDELGDLLESNKKVRELMESHPNWIDISKKLEGNIRNVGSHSAGIVISNEPIDEHVPLMKDNKDGYLTTQYDMKDLGELGLLKLDMLGLRTLDLIQMTLDLIETRTGTKIEYHRIPKDDQPTYNMLQEGKFVSTFQYDSEGMRSSAKAIMPEKFEHLMALNALYRSSCLVPDEEGLSVMDRYIERRHGRQPAEAWHVELEEAFKNTYSLPLYQEQLMNLTKIIAGFTDVEADEYRAAVGKKDAVKFEAAQKKFKERALAKGRDPAFIDSLVHKISGFARYGWNIAHAGAYSFLSYVTAWLETHYPLEYYVTLLNVNLDDNDKLKIFLPAILRKGIKLLPPHINYSKEYFHTDGKAIFMGLYSIRQLGEVAAKMILDDRAEYGPYTDYIDFCIRMAPYGKVTKLIKENLVKAGAFSWDNSMSITSKIQNTETIQDTIKKFIAKVDIPTTREQVLLKIVPPLTEYSQTELLSMEKAILNFYITSHPIMGYQALFDLFAHSNIITPSQIENQAQNSRVIVLGLVENKTMKTTKKGDPYIDMSVGDQIGNVRIMVWQPLSTVYFDKILVGQMVMLHGQIREDKFKAGEPQLYVTEISPIGLNGIPVGSVLADSEVTANRIVSVLNANALMEPNRSLSMDGRKITFRENTYIKPEQYDALKESGRSQYMIRA